MANTTCALRRRDGTPLETLTHWAQLDPVVIRRRAAGEASIVVSLTDPAALLLVNSEGDPEVPFNTWWNEDIELSITRNGQVRFAGPIVSVTHRRGVLIVRAMTQEAYLLRSVIGGDIINYAIGGYPDEDPDLDGWDAPDGVTVSRIASSGYDGYTRGYYVEASGTPSTDEIHVSVDANLPLSPNGNYFDVTVVVQIPEGTTDLYGYVGRVVLCYSDTEFGAYGCEYDSAEQLFMPAGWKYDSYYVINMRLRQPANVYTKVRVDLMAYDYKYAYVRVTRPQNVGAPAGQDIGTVLSAIFDQQLDLLIGAWERQNFPVGIGLAESVRYFSEAHEDVVSSVGEWDPFGEWWVEDETLYWAPTRGILVAGIEIDQDNISDLEVEVNAMDAVNDLYVQTDSFDLSAVSPGPKEQYHAVVDGRPNRLNAVVQAPAGLGPRDLKTWGDLALGQLKPERRVTGIPAWYDMTEPGDLLDHATVGDWIELEIVDETSVVPLTYTIEPVLDEMTWDINTDVVTPTWVVGGMSRSDIAARFAAISRLVERRRRLNEVSRPQPRLSVGAQTKFGDDQTWSSGDAERFYGTSVDVTVPPGAWLVTVRNLLNYSGTPATTDGITATITSQSAYDEDSVDLGTSTGVARAQAVVVGPGDVVNISTGVSVFDTGAAATRQVTWSMVRVAADEASAHTMGISP